MDYQYDYIIDHYTCCKDIVIRNKETKRNEILY